MSKHTPGPWHVGRDGWILSKNPVAIAEVYVNEKANARLIAAAPDLLKACKDVLSTIEGGDNDDAFIRAMQEAVQKAEGNHD